MSNATTDTISSAMRLRLGWLEAFVATALHLSYEGAAREVGIDALAVKLNVEELERWLHRLLVLDGTPLEIYDADDICFLAIATECLQLFSVHQVRTNGQPATVRKSKTSLIRLIDIQSFIKVVECGNYKSAAYDIGCSHNQIRRNILSLEKALGKSLITGRSIIHATSEGLSFLDDAKILIQTLLSSRAVIPSGYNPAATSLQLVSNALNIRNVQISAIISNLEKRKRSKILESEISEGQKILNHLDGLLMGLSEIETAESAG